MLTSRPGALAGGLLALVLAVPGHAAEHTVVTGYNDGSQGTIHLVYGVNVPAAQREQPRTFGLVGDCNFVPGSGFDTDHLVIAVEGHASAGPSWDLAPVISTTVLCEVVGTSNTVVATGATAGGATAAVGLGEVTLDDLGRLEVCVTVTARFADTTFATSDRACLPPDGILARRR